MASISVGEALGAGFRVIRRKPLTPLVWGIVSLVLVTLPYLLMMGSGISGFLALSETSTPEEIQRAFGPMSAWGNLLGIWSIVVSAVLMSAVFRSVLEPEDDKTFYLRVGGREAWLGLVYFCQSILAVFALIPIILVMAFTGGLAAVAANFGSDGEAGGAGLVAGPIILLGVAVFVWLLLRFSMALPLTFRDRTFRLFESWAFTKGYSLQLFLLALALVLLLVVIYVVLAVIGFALLAALGGGELSVQALESAFEGSPEALVVGILPWLVGIVAVMNLIGGYLLAIFYAPWADAFRQIAEARGQASSNPAATSQGH